MCVSYKKYNALENELGRITLIVKLDCCETKIIFSRDHKLSWLFSEQNACGSQAATLVRNFDHCLVCIIASDAVIIPRLLDWRCYFQIQSTQIISQWISVPQISFTSLQARFDAQLTVNYQSQAIQNLHCNLNHFGLRVCISTMRIYHLWFLYNVCIFLQLHQGSTMNPFAAWLSNDTMIISIDKRFRRSCSVRDETK